MTEPNSCIMLKHSIYDIQETAARLLNDADLSSTHGVSECFGCGIKYVDVKKCSGCKLAKYCNEVNILFA